MGVSESKVGPASGFLLEASWLELPERERSWRDWGEQRKREGGGRGGRGFEDPSDPSPEKCL